MWRQRKRGLLQQLPFHPQRGKSEQLRRETPNNPVTTETNRTSINQRLFDGRIDAERNYRYYSVKADRYRRLYSSIAFFIGLGSFSPIVLEGRTILEFDARILLPALAGVATLYLISFDIPGKTARADNAKRFYMIINHEWRDLWWNHSPDTVLHEVRMLEIREHAFVDTGIGIDDKLSRSCHESAKNIVLAEYVKQRGSHATGS